MSEEEASRSFLALRVIFTCCTRTVMAVAEKLACWAEHRPGFRVRLVRPISHYHQKTTYSLPRSSMLAMP